MSDRRMFSKRITQTAKFLQMPPTTQLLYFHLGLNADDDGVVEAFPVMRMINSAEDDLRVLVAKGLIKILNQDLVAYICDWKENNYIRGDRKRDSIYKDLLIQVVDQENGENITDFNVSQMSVKCQSSDSQVVDPSKVKLSKDKLSEENTLCTTSETEVVPVSLTKYVFPCKPSKSNKNTQWVLSKEDLEFYKDTYPNIDLDQEFRKMYIWLKNNNLKTYSGMGRFISNWLARTNDRQPHINMSNNAKQETSQQRDDRNLKAMLEIGEKMLKEWNNDNTGNNNISETNQNAITDNTNTRV